MFMPSVRRDIYRVMRNPLQPTRGLTAEERKAHESLFAVALLARKNHEGIVDGYSFVDRRTLNRMGQKYALCSDIEVLNAIKSVGLPTEHGIALTIAFETYLAGVTSNWGDHEASSLSVEFLVAFGTEMTKRLDVNHRIRSGMLSESDVAILKAEPFSACVDISALQAYGAYTNKNPFGNDPPQRRKRPDSQKRIVEAEVRTQFFAHEMRAREQDLEMFTASLRRDIYKVLRNPNNFLFGAPIPIDEDSDVLGAVLLARKGPNGDSSAFAFADRHHFESLPEEEKEGLVKLEDH